MGERVTGKVYEFRRAMTFEERRLRPPLKCCLLIYTAYVKDCQSMASPRTVHISKGVRASPFRASTVLNCSGAHARGLDSSQLCRSFSPGCVGALGASRAPCCELGYVHRSTLRCSYGPPSLTSETLLLRVDGSKKEVKG